MRRAARGATGWILFGTALFVHDGTPGRRGVRHRGGRGIWRVNDAAVPAVAGCIDLDLGFSPATNLLPIRRAANAYAYVSADTAYRGELKANDTGLVTDYPGPWVAET